MLRAGSLFYALAISVVIAIVSGGLLMAAYFTRIGIRQDETVVELQRNLQSGLELLLDESFTSTAPVETDLFGHGNDSVELQKKSWGAFEIALVKAHRRNRSQQLAAATGWQNEDATALVLADLDRPLSVAGKTELRGDCYLPKAGIQRAYIEGQSYLGDRLVYGQQKTSERFLPPYNEKLVNDLLQLFDFSPGENDSVITPQELQLRDSLDNSFFNTPLYVVSSSAISLNNEIISGQVCIVSRQSIHLGKNAALKNVVLVAPKIIIDDDVAGEFQAFARDSLIAGKNVQLHYPSVLAVTGTAKSPDGALLAIGEKSTVMGELFVCSRANDFRKNVRVQVSSGATVYGSIYCDGLLDLQGSVSGSVICRKFELKTNSAVYDNHLLNAVIDRGKRNAAYVGSSLVPMLHARKTVVQWLP